MIDVSLPLSKNALWHLLTAFASLSLNAYKVFRMLKRMLHKMYTLLCCFKEPIRLENAYNPANPKIASAMSPAVIKAIGNPLNACGT
jgi:hypothetical protein